MHNSLPFLEMTVGGSVAQEVLIHFHAILVQQLKQNVPRNCQGPGVWKEIGKTHREMKWKVQYLNEDYQILRNQQQTQDSRPISKFFGLVFHVFLLFGVMVASSKTQGCPQVSDVWMWPFLTFSHQRKGTLEIDSLLRFVKFRCNSALSYLCYLLRRTSKPDVSTYVRNRHFSFVYSQVILRLISLQHSLGFVVCQVLKF